MDTWRSRDSFCHPIKANCVKSFLHFIWKRFPFLKVWVKVYGVKHGGRGCCAGKWRAPASRFPFQWKSIEILCPVECENPFEIEQTFLKTKPHGRYIQNRWRYICKPLQIKFKQVKYSISDIKCCNCGCNKTAKNTYLSQFTRHISYHYVYIFLVIAFCVQLWSTESVIWNIYIKLMSSLHGTITYTETASCFNCTAFLKPIQWLKRTSQFSQPICCRIPAAAKIISYKQLSLKMDLFTLCREQFCPPDHKSVP